MQPERLGDLRRREACADALARALDLHAGALEQFEQRTAGELLPVKVTEMLSGTCVVR